MWGNKTGWLMSAVIAVIMLALMWLLQQAGTTPSSMTDKFKNDPDVLKPIALPIAPETILPMTDDCDAAGPYAEAIAEYQAHSDLYEKFDPKSVDKYVALDKLVAGVHCKSFTLFAKEPLKVINFEREKGPIETLRKLGELCAAKGNYLAIKNKDFENGKKYAEAAFALGAKMYSDRIVYEELDAGLGVMGAGVGAMSRIANDSNDLGRVPELEAFDKVRKQFAAPKSRLAELHAITKTIDGNVSAQHAGDVFALAEKSQERMWRVEACLQLARTKSNVGDEGRAADQRYAKMVLRRLSDKDPDPVVKAAANKALNITEEEYNKQ
jgi:hypothetical protein